MKTAVGLIGVTGYTGQEILKILLRHPSVSVQYLGSRRLNKPQKVGSLLPSFRSTDLMVHPFEIQKAMEQCDLLFLALPHGTAMKLAPQILKKPGIRIVDLSGDFRLRSASLFAQAYGLRHASPSLLHEAAYGLSEIERDSIRGSRLVANPGCYPTATLLALAPLAHAGLLGKEGLIVDAKSGVTGAGRSVKEDLLFSEVNEDLRAYKVNTHQHIPEMEQELKQQTGHSVRMTFVPHLIPINRGLYATIYAPLSRRVTEKQLRTIYGKFYEHEPFIRLLPEGVWPQVSAVTGTNDCEINLRLDSHSRCVILLSAIDNLGKGAAGQAVQNMNLISGLPETAGLSSSAEER